MGRAILETTPASRDWLHGAGKPPNFVNTFPLSRVSSRPHDTLFDEAGIFPRMRRQSDCCFPRFCARGRSTEARLPNSSSGREAMLNPIVPSPQRCPESRGYSPQVCQESSVDPYYNSVDPYYVYVHSAIDVRPERQLKQRDYDQWHVYIYLGCGKSADCRE